MDKTKYQAEGVDLPQFSVKPFVKYGVGLRKTWCGRVTAYGQVYRLAGGRRGTDVQAGLNIPFNW